MPDSATFTVVAALVATIGLLIGWLLRGLLVGTKHTIVQVKEQTQPVTPQPAALVADAPDLNNEFTDAILSQLHDISNRLSSDVGEHSTRVKQISEEVRAEQPEGSETLLNAMTQLLEANQRMEQQLQDAENRIGEQARQLEMEVEQARTDALTSLSNRRKFDDVLDQAYETFQQGGDTTSILLLDVDHFKKFNDTHGHLAGDEVLRGVGRILQEMTGDDDLPCRYGGEEFAVIYPGRSIEQIKDKAESVRAEIAKRQFEFENLKLQVSASGGVAQLRSSEDIASFIQRADEGLYASKEAGRNCGHWHDGEDCHPLAEDTPATDASVEAEAEAEDPVATKEEDVQELLESTQSLVDEARGADVSDDEPSETTADLLDHQTLRADLREELDSGQDESQSVLLLRIDNFDRIVENRGEESGELVLKATQQFFDAVARDREHITQFDGDVFPLLLPGTQLDDAIKVALRLRQAIARCQIPTESGPLRFTVCVGVAERHSEESSTDLLRRSEHALKSAIDVGPNSCFFHDGETSHSTESEAAVV